MSNAKAKTAIHEAGHAVAARALGIAAGDVTIRETEDQSLGHAIFSDPRFDWRRGDGSKGKAADAFAVALFAGAEAERIILGSQDVEEGEDRARATACLAWAGAVRGASFRRGRCFRAARSTIARQGRRPYPSASVND